MAYADLTSSIEDYLARTDLSGQYQSFISMAESLLNFGSNNSPALRVRDMETLVDLTPTSGVCTLPADYLEYTRVTEKTSVRRTLDYITLDEANRRYPDGAAGISEKFTIIGGSLYTYPLAQNDIELVYYQAIPPLTAVDNTNWLLTKNFSLYLHASLIAAFDFTRDDAMFAKHAQIASSLINGMNHTSVLGKYARAGVSNRGVTP